VGTTRPAQQRLNARADTDGVSPSRSLRTAAVGVVTASALSAALAVTPSAAASPAPRHNLIPSRVLPAPTSANLPGTACPVFPADSIWHADVSRLPVDPHSAAWLSHMQASTRKLHPDFGPSGGFPYGIPFTVVNGSHPKVTPTFDYADESDQVGYPLGSDTLIEGGPGAGGDRHALVVDSSTCRLYETWDTRQSGSAWLAGSGATWDLGSDALRPAGWTSADAAGLPILPGLLRWDEVLAGNVDHAIRFTTNVSDRSYVWPARHEAGSVSDASYPPMGAWFRLRASYPTTGLSAQTITVINAMKKHGMILADNGSPWFFQGTADDSWPDLVISQLKAIPASAFQAVDVSSLQVSADSGASAQPKPPAPRHNLRW
jgi:hypothetical protein